MYLKELREKVDEKRELIKRIDTYNNIYNTDYAEEQFKADKERLDELNNIIYTHIHTKKNEIEKYHKEEIKVDKPLDKKAQLKQMRKEYSELVQNRRETAKKLGEFVEKGKQMREAMNKLYHEIKSDKK